MNQPAALSAKSHGKIWDEEQRMWVDKPQLALVMDDPVFEEARRRYKANHAADAEPSEHEDYYDLLQVRSRSRQPWKQQPLDLQKTSRWQGTAASALLACKLQDAALQRDECDSACTLMAPPTRPHVAFCACMCIAWSVRSLVTARWGRRAQWPHKTLRKTCSTPPARRSQYQYYKYHLFESNYTTYHAM